MKVLYYDGLEVHKNTIDIAYTYAGSCSEAIICGTHGASYARRPRK